jgi:hypothetical protein
LRRKGDFLCRKKGTNTPPVLLFLLLLLVSLTRVYPFKDEAQAALFKCPVRTAQ